MRPQSRILDKAFTGPTHLCNITVPIVVVFAAKTLTSGLPTATLGSILLPHLVRLGGKCKPHLPLQITKTSNYKLLAQGIPVSKLLDKADKGFLIKGAPRVLSK